MGIQDYKEIIEFANSVAKDFKKPFGYAGGRHQTSRPMIFIHMKHNGTIGKIEINKPGGSKFYLNPNPS